ncbi:MAG: archaeosortase/exosortase family protein [Flavipsychrobacter sp.]
MERIGIPDEQLTAAVQTGTIKLLQPFFNTVTAQGSSILIDNIRSVNIAPECNGLELIVLYIGFILCIPSNWKKMLGFIVVGTLVIYLLNLVRTALLAVMYYQSHSMTQFAHHYAFKIVIYAVVFAGWLLYVRKIKVSDV